MALGDRILRALWQPLHRPFWPSVLQTFRHFVALTCALWKALSFSLPVTVLVISCLDSTSVLLHALWAAFGTARRKSRGNLLLVSSTRHSVAHVLRKWRQLQRRHVVVHVLSGGKTKIVQCGAWSTVGGMLEDMGVPLNVAILLLPGRRELDDKMRVGEIVREGPMTVEVRCRGVGGGEEEDAALREAALQGDIDEVRRLLDVGANVHDPDKLGWTTLHLSSGKGLVEVSQMLIRAGADLHATNMWGNTPLHGAAFTGGVAVCQMLVEAGSNLHATNMNGCTPLLMSTNVEVSRMLVGAGADVHATDKAGNTPLHGSAYGQHVELSQMLIGAGANLTATNNEGQTPLDVAKQHGDSAVALLQESEPLTKSAAQGNAAGGEQ